MIIPHRNRLKRLVLCIWSIERSARICGITDYEVIVSDQHSDSEVLTTLAHRADYDSRVRVLRDPIPMSTADTPEGPVTLFSKTRAINRGIEASCGDVLTFLDCDAIVGDHWLRGAQWLASDAGEKTTRLCYRVRALPPETADTLQPNADGDRQVTEYFRRYDEQRLFPKAHEGYASPDINSTGCWDEKLTFGNSQFSIRRDVLGGVRCDEAYIGAGFEDLSFIAAIWKHVGKSYRGVIRTNPKEAMFHIRNSRGDDWYNPHVNRRNERRYCNFLAPKESPCPATTQT